MSEAVAVVENPFRNSPIVAAPSHEALSAVGAAREVAEVQASMTIARRFPRVEVEVMDKILQACTRPSLAEGALYEFARGGSEIRGPSIRLAEMLAQNWGHIDFGWRTLEERAGVTKVQAFAWDMQTGVRSQRVFDITHERSTKAGVKSLSDPRDVYEHVANAASRRLRACILNVIPGDVVEAATKQCEHTLKLKTEVTTELVADMLAKFSELGVTKQQIERRVQRRVEALTPGLMVQLRKIFTSLRDGMSKPGDWFPVEPDPQAGPEGAGATPAASGAPNPRQAVRERIQARRMRPVPAADPSDPGPVPGEPEPHEEPTAELPGLPNASQTLQDVVRFARAALTQEDIGRVRHIALQLEEEEEVLVAQAHISAAITRIG